MSLETSSVVLRCFSFFKVEPQRKVFFFSGQTAKGSYCTFKDDSAHASTRQLACAYVRVCFSLCREFPKLAFFFLHSVYKDRYYRITICVLTSIKKKREEISPRLCLWYCVRSLKKKSSLSIPGCLFLQYTTKGSDIVSENIRKGLVGFVCSCSTDCSLQIC